MPGTPPPDARAALLTVAHELSNALAVAQGRLQLAERHGHTDHDRLERDMLACAAAIRRAAVLLADLTHHISLPVGPPGGAADAIGRSPDQPMAIAPAKTTLVTDDALNVARQAPGPRQQAGDGSSAP